MRATNPKPANDLRSALWLVAIASAGGAAACNAIVDSTGYYELARQPADAGSDATTAGPGDAAADAAEASAPATCVAGTDRRSLERACTSSECVAFTPVLPACDGGLCPLAAPVASDAGADAAAPPAPPPLDAGSDDAGGDAAIAAVDAAGGGAPGPIPCSQASADPGAIVYVTGSTALAAFVNEVSAALAGQVTVVYQQSGSCVGVRSALDPTGNVLSPANGPATYYTAAGVQKSCALDPAEGLVADLGASDVFYSTCYLGQPVTPALPANVGENFGPVQVMNFAVPQSSTQQSISLAAAYYVFGFGGADYPVPPWTDPAELEIRGANSGTQALIAAAIGVPPARWKGVGHGSSQQVGDALVAAGQSADPAVAEAALGILASDYLLQNAQVLRGLAVRDDGGSCAYFPGTTAFARDNANTRDGHYPLWGPSHFYARVDPTTRLPLKRGVAQFIDALSGVTPVPGVDLIAEYASKGLVPQCAMHVTRSNDGGDYTPFKAPVACNCYFELRATGATSCPSCSTNAECPTATPNCNKFGSQPQHGYCDL